MEPIINPMLIYAIDTISEFKMAGVIALILAGIAMGFYLFGTSFDDFDNQEKKNERKNTIKTGLKIMVVIGVVVSILPHASTSYKMLAASYVTTDNVNAAGQGVKEVVDYIFEKVDEMHSGNK